MGLAARSVARCVSALYCVCVCMCMCVCAYVCAYMHARVYALSLAGTYLVKCEASVLGVDVRWSVAHLRTCAHKPVRPRM